MKVLNEGLSFYIYRGGFGGKIFLQEFVCMILGIEEETS